MWLEKRVQEGLKEAYGIGLLEGTRAGRIQADHVWVETIIKKRDMK